MALKKKDINALLGEKIFRASTFTAKPKPRKKIRPRAKNNTGWYNWAVENVWNARPHECEICKCNLHDPAPIVFSHLLSRGSYRRYKTDERNVRLVCGWCHGKWHEMGPEKIMRMAERNEIERSFAWKRMCALYYSLRDEANGIG